MYYIVNQRKHIIAADSQFLARVSAPTLEDLQNDIALGNLSLALASDDTLELTRFEETQNYSCSRHALSSLLGDMTLIEIQEETETEEEAEKTAFADSLSLDDEAFITLKEDDSDAPFALKDEDLVLKEDELELESIEIQETETEEIVSQEEVPEAETIHIDLEAVSRTIGISAEDYEHFLQEYIDTALTLEKDLQSTQEQAKKHAISTLSHLAQVLQLPRITQDIEKIENSEGEIQQSHIASLYQTLSSIKTLEEVPSALQYLSESVQAKSFGTLDLSKVTATHFDFQIEEAADKLNLPLDLIKEFVTDFIDLVHEETPRMLEAYTEGDLEKIQKIAHLLKGTSSNLHIKALSDTLYDIQYCEESSELEERIKTYWSYFLSFEQRINTVLKK